MKKNNIKPLVMSALTALAMGAVGTVGTFALFTDVASTTIEVASGKIELTTSITNLNVWELGETPVSANSDGDYVDSIGGKTHLEGTSFNLTKWAPGDGMKFKVAASNSSTVKAKIRLKVVMTGELAPALTLQVKDADENQLMAARGNRSLYTEWVDVSPNGNPASYVVQVDFLNHGFEITSREQGEDNKYQDKSANIVVIYEAVQANADVSTSILERVNTKLATDQVNEGSNSTMYDAVQDYLELDTHYDESDLKPYYWNSSEDLFVEAANVVSDKAHTYFKMYDEMPTTLPAHSIYASEDWIGSDPISLTGIGFDVGSNSSAFTSINYVGASAARTNIIRTNSFDTDVVVTAPADVVRHYGDARSVVINGIAQSSYHEYGRVAFIEIAKGRVALESGSEVKNLHFAAAAESTVDPTLKTFDEIKVAYSEGVTLPTFSRDAVKIAPQGTLVVELQKVEEEEVKTQDFVWLYQQGLKEQIRITDEKEVTAQEIAEAPKSTDSSVAPKTATAAEQIANNLLGNDTYEELIVQGKIDATTGAVVAAEVENLVEETGLTEESKSAAVEEIIESGISDVAADDNYVARVGGEFYTTFGKAFDGVKNVDNKTLRIIKSTNAVSGGNDQYTLAPSVKNFTLYIEEGCTLAFTSSVNGIFNYQTTSAGKFTLDGEGTITFTGNSQHGIVNQINTDSNIKTVAKNLTVESVGTGYLTNGNLSIESGKYKNINIKNDTRCISGGMFSYNLDDYVIEGKMCVASGNVAYPYVVNPLDPEHANFSLLHNEQLSYYKTYAFTRDGSVGNGDTIQFTGANSVVGVNYNVLETRFGLVGGATYDLNNHTIEVSSTSQAMTWDYNSNTPLTLKNGLIRVADNVQATKLSLCQAADENNAYVIHAENLSIDDKLADSALAHIDNGLFIKDSVDYFSIKGTEMIPDNYAARIYREGADREDYYFTSENGVAAAMAMAQNGDVVYANRYEAGATATLHEVNEKITVVRDGDYDYPSVSSTKGKVTPKDIDSHTREFKVEESHACYIGTTSYDDFVTAMGDLATSTSDATLTLDQDITLPYYYDPKNYVNEGSSVGGASTSSGVGLVFRSTLGKTYTIDFNGYKIFGNEHTTVAVIMFSSVNSASYNIVLKDSSNPDTGGIFNPAKDSNAKVFQFSLTQKSGKTLKVEGGIYDATYNGGLGTVWQFQNANNVTIEGGQFYSNASNYVYNGSLWPNSVKGGLFRYDKITSSGALGAKIATGFSCHTDGSHKTGSVAYAHNGYEYYQMPYGSYQYCWVY